MDSERNEPENPNPAKANDSAVRVRLRDVGQDDLPAIYEYQLDPELNCMAATKPRTSDEFDRHWKKIFSDPAIFVKAIVVGDVLAGCVSCFKSDGLDSVGYWVAPEFWGRGIATRALELLLEHVPIRPLHARVALTNAASLRVLQKCGFRIVGYQHSPADDRFLECEEAVLELARDRNE